MRIGVIADTHGFLDPQILDLYAGVDLILHAGDVGGGQILAELSEVAPVVAVRGNIDEADLPQLPLAVLITAGGVGIHMTHIFSPAGARTPPDPVPAGSRVVIFGHSHLPVLHEAEGPEGPVLYFNPASAGKKRFRNPRLTGLLRIDQGVPVAEHLELS